MTRPSSGTWISDVDDSGGGAAADSSWADTECNGHGAETSGSGCMCEPDFVGAECQFAKTPLSEALDRQGLVDRTLPLLLQEEISDLVTLRFIHVAQLRGLGIKLGDAIKLQRLANPGLAGPVRRLRAMFHVPVG